MARNDSRSYGRHDELLHTLIEAKDSADDIVSGLLRDERLDAPPARAAKIRLDIVPASRHRDSGTGLTSKVHPPPGACVYRAEQGGNQALLPSRSHRAPPRSSVTAARVTPRGAERWVRGHPWIYRSEVLEGPAAPGVVQVHDPRGRSSAGSLLLAIRNPLRCWSARGAS